MNWLDLADLPPILPRRLQIGPLILDLFHRDACHEGKWAGLFPREFEVLWRLAESQGLPLSRQDLLESVWRLGHDPRTNRVEVAIARIRAKLAPFGLGGLVETVEEGGYRINAEVEVPGFGEMSLDLSELDSYLQLTGAGFSMQRAGDRNDSTGKWKSSG